MRLLGKKRAKQNASSPFEDGKKNLQKKKDSTPQYRDRAKERRDDANPDYKGVEEYHGLAAEQTRYLGGDAEHTHLVKGLDYQLLTKTRGDSESIEEQKLESQYQETQKKKVVKPSPTVAPSAVSSASSAVKKKEEIRFVTSLGRAVHRLVVDNPTSQIIKPVEIFVPGRMSFEFDLDLKMPKDLPTTLIQSRSEWSQAEDRVTGAMNPEIIKKIKKICTIYAPSPDSKSRKKVKSKTIVNSLDYMIEDDSRILMTSLDKFPKIKEEEKQNTFSSLRTNMEQKQQSSDSDFKQPASSSLSSNNNHNSSNDNDDIFSVAGEYVARTGKEKALLSSTSQSSSSYFGISSSSSSSSVSSSSFSSSVASLSSSSSTSASVSAPIASAINKKVSSLSASAASSEIVSMGRTAGMDDEKERAKKLEERKQSTDDDYLECYPGFELADEINDSDDEDLTKMDQGRAGALKKRWDFETEEDWARYNLEREAAPKAAFQFGQKMKDGRIKGGKKVRKGEDTDKVKLNREWQQIQSILKQKGPKGKHKDKEGGDEEGEQRGKKKHKGPEYD
eukprot:TRINITY_DN1470_c0_g1_i1.p1 TRINITY_DN1470_c0_g1~~TRINITY_DN1470_c0_g1_i1.p1  ORF type:complete len:561 (-),score=163.11 TRINITY_DN1470_c0_g1_i1:107-1789(-)